jgi:hypothetical protein
MSGFKKIHVYKEMTFSIIKQIALVVEGNIENVNRGVKRGC